MYIDMINHPDFDKYDLSSVREGEMSLFFFFLALALVYYCIILMHAHYLSLFHPEAVTGATTCPLQLAKKIESSMQVRVMVSDW